MPQVSLDESSYINGRTQLRFLQNLVFCSTLKTYVNVLWTAFWSFIQICLVSYVTQLALQVVCLSPTQTKPWTPELGYILLIMHNSATTLTKFSKEIWFSKIEFCWKGVVAIDRVRLLELLLNIGQRLIAWEVKKMRGTLC